MRPALRLLASVVALGILGVALEPAARLALAAPAKEPAKPRPRWSEGASVDASIAGGAPLVLWVVVPLCSNDQIDCAGEKAGEPRNLERNLYWGAIFGQKRFFERDKSPWQKLSDELDPTEGKDAGELERVAYKRDVDGAPWGRTEKVEQIVVLSAFAGDRIDDAVGAFYKAAAYGREVTIHTPDERRLAVTVAGYAGHDRLMDGLELPTEPAEPAPGAIPSFVFACYSKTYFGPALSRIGSKPLVLTKALMAPEGYVVDAAALALGAGAPREDVVEKVVQTYAKWQRVERNVAAPMFE